MQGPQPAGRGFAPASSNVCQMPRLSASSCTHLLAAPRYNFTPGATFFPCSTVAAAARSSIREFTQESRYAFSIAIFCFSISASEAMICTVSGPETCGVTCDRSSTMRAA